MSSAAPPLPGIAVNDNRAAIDRDWVAHAAGLLADERTRSSDTPLLALDCPELPGIRIVLKDESAHPSGSLKHRLAHALYLHAICSGEIGPETTVVEASSGSTAIAEAWFARALGLRFVAVVPAHTAPGKLAAIRALGGEIETVGEGVDLCAHAEKLAWISDGHFMNQFARAAEATDWRGANSIAESLFRQVAAEGAPPPAWVVVGAGTAGTCTTIGRYVRLRPELAATRLCLVDPEGSALFAAYASHDSSARGRVSPVVEGIGRPTVPPGFHPRLIDQMLSIPDIASVAGAHWLRSRLGRAFGPSTGTNIVGALLIGQAMARAGVAGTIATLACDSGALYADTIYDPAWLDARGLDLASWSDLLARLAPFRFPSLS